MANPFASHGFRRQNRQIFTKTSISKPDSDRPSSPSTIILCTWMAANPRHIRSYLSNYTRLFPHSHILLILAPRTTLIFFPRRVQQAQILPAVRFLAADERKDFLVHIFSGGGAVSLRNLAIVYCDHSKEEPELLPLQKLILDSTPGQKTDNRAADAWVHVLPPTLKGKLATWIARHFFQWLWLFVLAVIQSGDPFANAWTDLNDVGIIRKKCKRVYIYSEVDISIGYEDVLMHGEIAKEKGYKVRRENFRDSGHVAHALADGKRYWRIVEGLWRENLA